MMMTSEAEKPAGANDECVGPQSAMAGLAPSCAGCPNAAVCAAAPKGPDPDLALIRERLSGVRHRVMVVSGKGGVGKSTLTKELAFALGARGYTVGLVDLDLCGPSLPRLTGTRAEDAHQSAQGIEPVLVNDQVTLVSMHYFTGDDKNSAVTLRGARKNGVIKMFLKDVVWGELDVLLMDTPPGTSDEHITTATVLRDAGGIDGAVLVTTPQLVAEADVRREVSFCHKAKLPVLGLVENMSGFVCPSCHRGSVIFPNARGESAGERLSREFGIPLWGRVPLDPLVMRACEDGVSLMELLDTRSSADANDANEEGEGEQQLKSSAFVNTATVNELLSITDKLIQTLGLPPPANCC